MDEFRLDQRQNKFMRDARKSEEFHLEYVEYTEVFACLIA